MGAHLRHGDVVGEQLRCALHHYRFERGGTALKAGCPPAQVWAVAERFGLVFVNVGDEEPDNPPCPDGHEQFAWTTCAPVTVDADWRNMIINGFDMPHLAAVHHRELVDPPAIQRSATRMEIRYTSRVTGTGASDRAMKWISGDRIRVRQRCYGTVSTVETDLGRTQTAAVVAVLPVRDKVRAFGAFGVRPGPLTGLRLAITRWLFTAFLERDFDVVRDMAMRTDVEDPGVREIATFLASLPAVAP